MTARERLRAGLSYSAATAMAKFGPIPARKFGCIGKFSASDPKPWKDRDRAPWGNGDSDGEDHGVHEYEPGSHPNVPPDPDPDGDDLNLRSSCAEAAEAAAHDPEAARALLAIEARLGEISLYIPIAKRGAQGKALTNLILLASVL